MPDVQGLSKVMVLAKSEGRGHTASVKSESRVMISFLKPGDGVLTSFFKPKG